MANHGQPSEPTPMPHCLAVPFPTQGHINPILEFSKRLIPKGIRVTLLLTPFISKSISARDRTRISALEIGLETIADGHDEEGCPTGVGAQRFDAYVRTFREIGSKALARLVQRMADSGESVHCIIYDSIIPWCLDVAKEFGILTADFFTQSCAVDAIYYGVREGKVPVGETTGYNFGVIPGLPALERRDLPTLLHDCGPDPDPFGLILGQFSNAEQADWVLCNSVLEVEQEELSWLSNFLPFTTVGPTIPLPYLNNQHDNDDTDLHGLSIFKPFNESTCANWLETKPKHSVVYVSFGSIAGLAADQMEELFWGLRNSNHYFLWVVRQSEESKLPKESELSAAAAAERGLIVRWCSQLEVLASEAVGCFVTHCGWNSTLEGLSLGVPMVAVPQWSDQPTNAKYVKDVWRVGVRVVEGGGGESGAVVGREEIERCLREVMEGESGEEIRRNSEKWKNVIREAAGEGGSSGSNVGDFAASLISKSRLVGLGL
ncbi:unnamed protein product [Linum trigynum]|uniref:Glycosyltransferase n=1 Tax=Linum trigynum TaxID=586398 RepID=A0AAV2FS82_9ROSI